LKLTTCEPIPRQLRIGFYFYPDLFPVALHHSALRAGPRPEKSKHSVIIKRPLRNLRTISIAQLARACNFPVFLSSRFGFRVRFQRLEART
jgi:hypothetical protein